MDKNLSIVISGSGEIHDITIKPGTTAKDILRELNLTGYILSKGEGHQPFSAKDNVYPEVKDGQKLYAATKADAGL